MRRAKFSHGVITSRKLFFQFLCLINQHDRDIILYAIKEFALVAYETGFRFIGSDISLALRACENFKQVLADSHEHLLRPH
jgi:hypothetical protein